MTTKQDIVQQLIPQSSDKTHGVAFAPSNIALAKYWGKRDTELNLPQNSSLSISLGNKGATATLMTAKQMEITVNQQPVDLASAHAQRLSDFLSLFPATAYRLTLEVNLPFAAGLASSACIFAAIVLALNELHGWQLDNPALSILARLGSGSAARSIERGFVEWHCGQRRDGLDSYAEPIEIEWPELRLGLCLLSTAPKPVSSRKGMSRTVSTSPLYPCWPAYADKVVTELRQNLLAKDFAALGMNTEQCAQTMHATMQSARPSFDYSLPKTLAQKQTVWQLRNQGHEVFFTQDAGPNLKLIFLDAETETVQQHFPEAEILTPFNKGTNS